ncbi:hypothetical protein CMP1-55 [Clavibacter phage CMP1]|uniref:Uncharacterized protein n=1 Tax=Clavibacter phage CMP1 TaxID=686439 RepID=D0U239_9CAUD|nr:hypothetical protein CMP1-55 [Clavibacter phage CMP1]ACY35968.1 hypothetical protein CMP1-55 [Clavibacter phage CMP1]
MSKTYTAFDPAMIGKVITINANSAQVVGTLRDYAIVKNGDKTYYAINGDTSDVSRVLYEGETIDVHEWYNPNEALDRIAGAIEAAVIK